MLLDEIPLMEEPVTVSVDRNEQIYLGGSKGNIYKYDNAGELLFTFSPQRQGNIKNVEAWSTLNTFVFYEGLQEFSFLDRFLTLITTQKFDADLYARLATISADNNLWIFDDQDYALKKINLNYFVDDIHTPLNNLVSGNFNGTHLREYQNFVFLADSNKGIYIFDNLGNYIKELPFQGVFSFNFHKNELYFLNESTLTLYDIYSTKTRHFELRTDKKYNFALITDQKLFLLSKSSLDIYAVQP